MNTVEIGTNQVDFLMMTAINTDITTDHKPIIL